MRVKIDSKEALRKFLEILADNFFLFKKLVITFEFAQFPQDTDSPNK